MQIRIGTSEIEGTFHRQGEAVAELLRAKHIVEIEPMARIQRRERFRPSFGRSPVWVLRFQLGRSGLARGRTLQRADCYQDGGPGKCWSNVLRCPRRF